MNASFTKAVVGLLAMTCAGPLAWAEPHPLAQQADQAWRCRDQAGQTEKAIQLWEEAVKAEPHRGDLRILLAKAMGRAVRHASSLKEQRMWAERARSAATQAIEKLPGSSEAYTVYGEALGQWAEAHKGFQSLKAVRLAVAALHKATTIDPTNAYAHMLLAEFYRQSPRFFSVGNKTEALSHAQLAVQYGSHLAINHLALARAYLDLGRRDEGIRELQAILALTCPAEALPETSADQETARSLLASLGVTPAAPPQNSTGCSETTGVCSEEPAP